MQISGIFVYPVKSLGGIALHSAKVEARGLQYDRRWMIVDPNGMFLTQREYPEMTLLIPTIETDYLVIRHLTKPFAPLTIPLKTSLEAEPIQVQVFDDICTALVVNREADVWLSEALQTPCRLVYMPDHSRRPTDPAYSQSGDIVSFADGFPILIVGEASLEDLNQRLQTPVPMNRFRPNLVFSGGLRYEEDTWKNFKIGKLHFRGVKTCGRCAITTINQDTAERGSEPLKTLASYRLSGKRILFGMNVCWDVDEILEPMVKIGDEIVM